MEMCFPSNLINLFPSKTLNFECQEVEREWEGVRAIRASNFVLTK